MSRPTGVPEQFWDAAHEAIMGTTALDRDIDDLQRAIGANTALVSCLQTPGWEIYHKHLAERLQKKLDVLKQGTDLDLSQIRFIQGGVFELEQIVTETDSVNRSNVEMQQRLDQLLQERKNRVSDQAPTT